MLEQIRELVQRLEAGGEMTLLRVWWLVWAGASSVYGVLLLYELVRLIKSTGRFSATTRDTPTSDNPARARNK